ncbi:hypothetical protein Daus18300_008771 [Diaporthe australafricana]|uniref:Ketoreductase domain-containing protein n=1 Tax=Diaporthe australafricana TaxID=127596 RepID=A0ABR3WH07_9PEZI
MTLRSREGLTVDLVSRVARRTVLNPWLAIPVSAWTAYGVPTISKSAHVRLLPYLCALVGTVLCVNEWLNKWALNNWTRSGHPDWDWAKEIVVVTGGSGGIGASIARQILARNSRTTVVIVDYAPMTWTPKTGTHVAYYQCDLSNAGAIRALAGRIRSEVGHPTVLVNNAGLSRGATVMDGSYADVELTIKTNLIAPFLLVKEFLPHMVSIDHGHIVNVGSASSLFPPARVADYAATKAGITAFHEALQLELKHVHNAPKVRLTLGILGFIKTPLFKGETRQSHFLFPLLHVDTVGEAFVDALYSGLGRTIYLPGIMRYLAMLEGRLNG